MPTPQAGGRRYLRPGRSAQFQFTPLPPATGVQGIVGAGACPAPYGTGLAVRYHDILKGLYQDILCRWG